MKVMAVNGSPRKKWNTATLLQKTLEGAASQGAETELIHLYDLDYKGCKSCFACKTKGGESYGRCAVKDDLSPVLDRIEKTIDAIVLGSPIYYASVTGEMRSFMERLMFPFRTYTDPPQSLFKKTIKTGFIYTMNVTKDRMKENDYDKHLSVNETVMQSIGGHVESLYCFDTYQFDDYSKVVADRFDAGKKLKRRNEIFPIDCEKAYDMGVRFAKEEL
jgi:multimeric flavodoxin WrbA